MIYFADDNWKPIFLNPFSHDGYYGTQWSAFMYDLKILNYTNKYDNTNVYILRVNPAEDPQHKRLKDFIGYETYYGRNVIIQLNGIFVPECIIKAPFEVDKKIKPNDPRWMVHSTTAEAWLNIQNYGMLLSPNQLKKRKIDIEEIGLSCMLEPADYSDYIMLDILNGCGEIVVNSRQLGYVCTDPNFTYTPGVRLYFDAYKIIKDGLAVRDGVHLLKVKDKLPLDKFLVTFINKDLLSSNSQWTPSSFTDAANKYFLECFIQERISNDNSHY